MLRPCGWGVSSVSMLPASAHHCHAGPAKKKWSEWVRAAAPSLINLIQNFAGTTDWYWEQHGKRVTSSIGTSHV